MRFGGKLVTTPVASLAARSRSSWPFIYSPQITHFTKQRSVALQWGSAGILSLRTSDFFSTVFVLTTTTRTLPHANHEIVTTQNREAPGSAPSEKVARAGCRGFQSQGLGWRGALGREQVAQLSVAATEQKMGERSRADSGGGKVREKGRRGEKDGRPRGNGQTRII